jgi:MlaC protein
MTSKLFRTAILAMLALFCECALAQSADNYRLYKAPQGWRVYDINILGAWLVQLCKQQFADQIAQHGVDGLISFLTQRNQQLANGGELVGVRGRLILRRQWRTVMILPASAGRLEHTPAFCHASSRRQHTVPEPEPISCGSRFHEVPERSTCTMPVSTAPSGIGLRPAYRRLRGARTGSNGSISDQCSSSMSSLGIASCQAKQDRKLAPSGKS